MEDCEVRRRGRPKGTGKDDSAALRQIAKLMLSQPTMRPTTAMKRCGFHNLSDIRRLQIKWKAEGDAHLEAVKERCGEQRRGNTGRSIGRVLGAVEHLISSPGMRALQDAQRHADRITAPIREAQRRAEALRVIPSALEAFVEGQRRRDEMLKALTSPLSETLRQLEEQANPMKKILDDLKRSDPTYFLNR